MIRRGTEPRKGFWAIPVGFMECGENPEQSAARELLEETGARIDSARLELFLVGSLPEISEVYLVYRGELLAPYFEVTEEALSVGLFDRDNHPPWEESAYPDVTEFIERFYEEHENGSYSVYSARYVDGNNEIKKIGK